MNGTFRARHRNVVIRPNAMLTMAARMSLTTVTRKPQNWWHWKDWLAQGGGTAFLLLVVVTAKDPAVRAAPPVSGLPWRDVMTALAAGTAVALAAVSAMGRPSGAHLNPRSPSVGGCGKRILDPRQNSNSSQTDRPCIADDAGARHLSH
jgi:hypothetical protein